ncbi:MAG: aspartate aminotransferase family protein [Firmicutes bacterium]|nr:aspartate aminotransferase family protein [Bacillota bacterium]
MTKEFKAQYSANLLPTYARYPVAFVSGKGSKIWDDSGKEYIDFMSGMGVCSVGHSHPDWVSAIAAQAGELAHVSNLYHTAQGGLLAQRLCDISGMSAAFFANSGGEANEGLIKLARKYSKDYYGTGRSTILTLENSFHGRTMATLSATGQARYHQTFEPFLEGFRHVPANDLAALEAQGNDVCALLIEVIQGENGVIPLNADYVQQAAELCKDRDWLLMVDEVQTGVGRTGKWFAFQHYDIEPDAISIARGVASGLPLSAFLVSQKLHNVLEHNDHASTFGGNLLCCAAALATLDILTPILPEVSQKGEYIRDKIVEMNLPAIAETRGNGLMLGIRLNKFIPSDITLQLLESGLATLTAGTDAIKFLPPLTISNKDIDDGLAIFSKIMKSK